MAAMEGWYDPLQVGLSVLIAIASSYAALDLGERVTANRDWVRVAWLAGGAIAMGSGISAMHFVGVQALQLPVRVFYDWPTVFAGLLIAIGASAVALIIVSWKRMCPRHAMIGGTILGCGVAALHYLEMGAMRMAASYTLNALMVAVSVGLGIAFAVGGLWLGCYFRDQPPETAVRRLGAALLMGASISGLHYTGMAAATFRPATALFPESHVVYISTLATLGIAVTILILLATTMVTCVVDRQFRAQAFQLALAQGKVDLARTTRQTLLGELTASIAHEIRQPIAAIVTNANYSLRQIMNPEPNLTELRQALQEIVDDGNRTNAVISRIRALIMKEHPERIPVDVNEILRNVQDFAAAETSQNNIRVEMDLAPQLPPVLADRVQLQQAFINVIMNSIEAMQSIPEAERRIIIRSRENEQGIVVRIQDSGPGIKPDEAERLFQPFFTTKPEGMGLGLSISRSLVEAHRGYLSYLPDSEGAIFEFFFPSK